MNTYSAFGIVTAILFVILPFATSRHFFHAAVNTKYFLVIGAVLILAALAAAAYVKKPQEFGFKKRPLLWVGVIVLGVYWLSALLGIFPERSIFSDILRSTGVFFLTHLAVFAIVISEFFRARDWSLVRRTIALSTAVYSFFTILGIEGLGISGRILWTNLDIHGYTFGNSTFAGTYLLLALAVTLIELVRTPFKTRWWYMLLGALAFIVSSPVLVSIGNFANIFAEPFTLLGSARASSAAAIALLTFFGGYVLLKKYVDGRKRILSMWGGLFIAASVMGVALLFTPGSIVQEKYIELSTGARLLVWQNGLEAFAERPVLGWGAENFDQAMQGYFDNRLYQDEFIGEIWFDRAHNVLVDTLVNVGVVGLVATLVVVGAFVLVVYRARRHDIIGEFEAAILYALPLAHFLQLQTGFDTIGSFALIGFLGGYGLYLERIIRTQESTSRIPPPEHTIYYKVGAGMLAGLVLVSSYITITEFNRQKALFRIFVEQNPAERLVHIETATSRISSFESLRLSYSSMLKGTLERVAEGILTEETREVVLHEAEAYEARWQRFLAEHPNHYRARMNLAYLLSVERVLGGDNQLDEAKRLVSVGYELSPDNLLTPAMEALLELYSGNLDEAEARAEEIVRLNPNAPFGREVLAHIQKQRATFPTISVLQLENL